MRLLSGREGPRLHRPLATRASGPAPLRSARPRRTHRRRKGRRYRPPQPPLAHGGGGRPVGATRLRLSGRQCPKGSIDAASRPGRRRRQGPRPPLSRLAGAAPSAPTRCNRRSRTLAR
eukprot:2345108-Alexandrium_andersonii.AAC.1